MAKNGEFKRGETPLPKTSPSLITGRGTKGEGYLIKIRKLCDESK